jgi:SnoaL-like domain
MKLASTLSSSQHAVQLVLEFFARVWHPPHDLSAIDELMTEDYVITSAGRGHQGREAFKAWVRQFRSQLLNVTTESVDAFPSPTGDRVVPRWVCSGQHNGPEPASYSPPDRLYWHRNLAGSGRQIG